MTPAIDPTDLYFPFDHTDYKHAYLDLRARIRELVGALQTAVDCGRLCAEHQQVARATLAREKGGGA